MSSHCSQLSNVFSYYSEDKAKVCFTKPYTIWSLYPSDMLSYYCPSYSPVPVILSLLLFLELSRHASHLMVFVLAIPSAYKALLQHIIVAYSSSFSDIYSSAPPYKPSLYHSLALFISLAFITI